MKLRHFFVLSVAALAALFSCDDKEEDLGGARISITDAVITLDKGEDSKTVTFVATRDWFIVGELPEWIAMSATEGQASSKEQTLTVSVAANPGNDRQAVIEISIGMMKAPLTVKQLGELGPYVVEEGDGSKDSPFSVEQACDAVKNLSYTDNTNYEKVGPYYVKGKIVSIKEAYSTEYGNAEFVISDDGSADGAQLTCYRVLYLENKKWQNGNEQINPGDVVVIYGELMNFKGNTPETVQKGSYLYSLNGKTVATGGEEIDYSKVPAKTVAEFISAADKNNYYKLTGKVSRFNSQYCSFDLTDDSGTIYVYSVDNSADWSSKIKDGATVTLAGKYAYYEKNQQHEVVNAVILSCEGGEEVDPNAAPAITVADLIAKGDEQNYYKLTGTVSNFNSQYCSFDLTDATGTIYVYSVANKTDWVNKINDGATIVLAGKYQLYKKTDGTQQPEIVQAIIISCEGGTPAPQDEPKGDGTLANPYNPKAALDLASSLDKGAKTPNDVYVKGKISSVKYTFDVEHGTATFNISESGEASGTTQFQVYAVLYLNNRAWAEGDTQVKVGDEVIICGKLINYNGTPETASKEAYIYSLNGVTDGGDPAPVLNVTSIRQTENGFTASWTTNVSAENIVYYAWTLYRVSDEAEDGVVYAAMGRLAPDATSIDTYPGSADGAGWYEALVPGTKYYFAINMYGSDVNPIVSNDPEQSFFEARDMSQSGDVVTVTFTTAQLAAAACKGAKVAMDDVISFTNSSDYGTTAVTELRVYKGKTLTISAEGSATITSIEFTCTANGTTKQGPGCWGAGAPNGYTFDSNGKTGSWTGSASSVAFTATDNQVRIAELTVTYTK